MGVEHEDLVELLEGRLGSRKRARDAVDDTLSQPRPRCSGSSHAKYRGALPRVEVLSSNARGPNLLARVALGRVAGAGDDGRRHPGGYPPSVGA